MAKIDKLTPEQEALLDVYAKKWIGIGLETGRLDRNMVSSLIARMYEIHGLDQPKEIVFFDGPTEMSNYMKKRKISFTDNIVYGNHDAAWLSYYEYYHEVLGLEFDDKLYILFEMAKNCGWFLPYDEACFVVERPTKIVFDEDNRLHCENGPAIEYADGTKIYSFQGVNIPGEWIESPETSLKPEMALNWDNIEQRRIVAELLGWVKVLELLDSTVIDEDEDPEIGTLLEVNLKDIGRSRFLKVHCPTGRDFAIPVPPDTKSAVDANAWTYGIAPEDFKPEIRA